MTTQKPTAPLAQSVDGLVGAASDLGSSVAKLAAAMLAIPLSVLPPQARDDTTAAARDAIGAVGKLNVSIVKAVTSILESFVRTVDKVIADATTTAK